jgi:hypothetical protein
MMIEVVPVLAVLPQPNARAASIFRDEFDAGRFEGSAKFLARCLSTTNFAALSLQPLHGGKGYPRSRRKLLLRPPDKRTGCFYLWD